MINKVYNIFISLFLLQFFVLVSISFSFAQQRLNNIDSNSGQSSVTIDHHELERSACGPGVFWSYTENGIFLENKKGRKISTQKFLDVRNFSRGLAAASDGNHWGFIDTRGNISVPFKYDFVYDFIDEISIVVKEGKYFSVNKYGKIIPLPDIDYCWGFKNGIAKILKGDKTAYIDSNGVVLDNKWTINESFSPSHASNNKNLSRSVPFCPFNFDFDNCDFTNWTCYEGRINNGSGLSLSPTSPLTNRHIIINSANSGVDPYGGFPVNNGSSCASRIGEIDRAGRKAEALSYEFTPNVSDYTFTYQYALVFQDPGHSFSEQPRFKVTLDDLTTGQVIACASVDYTAGYGGASFFTQSSVGQNVFYKPWTPVFINLGRYPNHLFKITFTNIDCSLGGHWSYAYIDINPCDYNGISATNDCLIPSSTVLQGPSGYTNYVWSLNPNLSNPIGNAQNVVLPAPGLPINSTVYLQLIPDNGIACSDTLSVNVLKNEVVANFTPPDPQCLYHNNFSFISNSVTNGGTISSCTWNFGDNTTGSGLQTNHQYAYYDTFLVRLDATSSLGCTADTTIEVIVKESPVIVFSGNEICLGNNSLVVLSGADTFSWSPLSGLVFTSPVNDSVYIGNGITTPYNVTAKVNSTGCTADTIVQVIFLPNPLADFIQPAPECFRGNLFNFINNSTIGQGGSISSYLWSFGDDSISRQYNVTHSYADTGTYHVKLFTISSSGCKDTVEKDIVVYSNPSANILSIHPLKFCFGDSVILYANASAGMGSLIAYEWLNGGLAFPGNNQNVVTIYNTGSYQLSVENSFGCRDTSMITPVIAHPLPNGQLTTIPSNTSYICDGDQVEIRVINSNATTYQWYYSSLNQSNPPVPMPGADSSNIITSNPGYYFLQMTSFTDPVCFGTAIDTIRLQKVLQPKPDFSFPTLCANLPIHFTNLSDTLNAGPITWRWDFGDLSSPSNQTSPTHIYGTGTDYQVKLTITPTICPLLDSSISKIIHVEQPITGIRYPTVYTVRNTPTPLLARNFADRIEWLPSSGLSAVTIPNPIFIYDREVDYLIKMETNAGCLTYDSQLVRVQYTASIQVPTAFSPNYDGHNDILDIFLVGIAKLNYFKVFNRWGQLLYETNDMYGRWDGRFHGAPQPPETYVWIAEGIDYNGNKILKRGQTILLK